MVNSHLTADPTLSDDKINIKGLQMKRGADTHHRRQEGKQIHIKQNEKKNG